MSRFRWTVVLFAAFILTSSAGPHVQAQQTVEPFSDYVDAFPNFDEVSPGLFLGGRVAKAPKGTDAVLNLCEFEDPYKLKYHKWSKIPDSSPAPSLDWLREQVEFVDQHRKKDRVVYVHCYAGISRSTLVVTAYLMQKNNWTRDDTLARIRKTRPFASPNEAFMDLLMEWQKKR